MSTKYPFHFDFNSSYLHTVIVLHEFSELIQQIIWGPTKSPFHFPLNDAFVDA